MRLAFRSLELLGQLMASARFTNPTHHLLAPALLTHTYIHIDRYIFVHTHTCSCKSLFVRRARCLA